jgi:hypothetical protein
MGLTAAAAPPARHLPWTTMEPVCPKVGPKETSGDAAYVNAPERRGRAGCRVSGFGVIALLGCDCGEVGCWPLESPVLVDDGPVTWRGFTQPFRPTTTSHSVHSCSDIVSTSVRSGRSQPSRQSVIRTRRHTAHPSLQRRQRVRGTLKPLIAHPALPMRAPAEDHPCFLRTIGADACVWHGSDGAGLSHRWSGRRHRRHGVEVRHS